VVPVTAVVPLKALDRAKGRLSGELDAGQRRDLMAWMFTRVVAACAASPSVGRILAVVGDRTGAELAHRCGVEALVEAQPGLRAALAAADELLEASGSLIVAADLPLARPTDLDTVVAAGAARGGRVVAVAPTRDGGTGALLRLPGHVIPTAYGPGSARAHLDAARAVDAAAVRVTVPGLELDVDDAPSLREAAQRDPEVEAWAGEHLHQTWGRTWPVAGSWA